jgi:hypothetical protein
MIVFIAEIPQIVEFFLSPRTDTDGCPTYGKWPSRVIMLADLRKQLQILPKAIELMRLRTAPDIDY